MARVGRAWRPAETAGQAASFVESSTRSFEYAVSGCDAGRPRQWVDLRGIAVRDERGAVQRIVWHQAIRTGFEESKSSFDAPARFTIRSRAAQSTNVRTLLVGCRWIGPDGEAKTALQFSLSTWIVSRRSTISHGHLVGDRTLLAVAQRFSHCVRPEDVLARRDGDEFTILVTDIRYQNVAAAVAERILLQLRSPLSVDDAELAVSASIGIALSGTEWHGPDDLLRSADEAMYQAKARGGGRYVIAGRKRQNQRFARSSLSGTGS